MVSHLLYCDCIVFTRCGKSTVVWRLGGTENMLEAPQLVLADRKCPVDCSLDNLWMVFQLEILMKNEFIE